VSAMNWKTDLKLADLDPTTRLEVTCKRCGLSRYEQQAALMQRAELKQAYLDEVERALRCSNRFCKGDVRVALIHDDKTEGFVGGMA
jgi:hypothetical protein